MMLKWTMTIVVWAFLSSLVVGDEAATVASYEAAANRGRDFLVKLYDDEVQLLPEFRGHRVYWLYHDNYLVAKVLKESHSEIATGIEKSIRGFGENQSGKIEILFGESKSPLPFRHYDLVVVQRDDERTIRTERVTDREMKGWESYADLRLLASIALSETDKPAAIANLDAALAMWDGKGLADAVTRAHKIYATYKLALAVLAADRLNRIDKLPQGLVQRLAGMQSDSGGWITDYKPNGTPKGKANVETSCLAILAFDRLTTSGSK